MSQHSRRHGAAPFSVSQNFLTSAKTVKRLLQITSITKGDRVIEIGAGKGHITRELIKVSGSVDAYEIDGALCAKLRQKLEGAKNLRIQHHDFLRATLPRSGPYKVFSNIPFSITTGIVKKLTLESNPPEEMWLVMEKGAAKRFLGKPRDTLASLSIKPFFDAKIVYHFARQDFHPMPSVDTVLVHFVRKPTSDVGIGERSAFIGFVESGLKHGIGRQLSKKQIATALRLAGLPGIPSAGDILYIQWLCLFRCYRKFHGKAYLRTPIK